MRLSLITESDFRETNKGIKGLSVYHGGTDREGRHVTYYTTDKEAAETYVSMYNDRFGDGGDLHSSKIDINNPAPEDKIQQLAKRVGIDNEFYTPASVFDAELHGDQVVSRLVKNLLRLGYDGAVLKDISYGGNKEFDAYITFSRSKHRN